MIAFHPEVSRDPRFHGGVEKGVPSQYWKRALDVPIGEFLGRQGKRIRAELVELAYRVSGGSGEVPEGALEFVELVHAGSLIIDDIQDDAMDRRKRPTLHRMYGTPLAINTGNWMYFAAMEKLFGLPISSRARLAVLKRVTTTVRRCHEGQGLDLVVRAREADQGDVKGTVEAISRLKTGSLVSLAAWLGAVAARGTQQVRRVLTRYGRELGIALQMQNDLQDLQQCVERNESSIDLEQDRATWPWAWASIYCDSKTFTTLQQTTDNQALAERLLDMIDVPGRDAVGRQLRTAQAILQDHLSRSNSDVGGHRLLRRLEEYYV